MNKIIVADIKSNNNDGQCRGHYIPVAQNYFHIFNSVCNVKIAGGPVYKKYFEDCSLILLPFDFMVGRSEIINKIHVLLNARKLFRLAKSSTILLQQSTATTSFVCIWLFAKCYSNIYMIQYDLSGLRGGINRFFYNKAKKSIKGLLCPNSEVGKGYGLPYIVVPDYIYMPENKHRKTISYSEKKYDLCVLGRLNEDKGVIGTIRKFANTNYKIIVAGTPQGGETFVRKLESECNKSPNIKLVMGYLTNETYFDYINQSRYAILNYHGDYTVRSSGVVLDFIFNGVPVIAHRCQAMQFLEDYKIGSLYDDLASFDLSIYMNQNLYNSFLNGINMYKQKFVNDIDIIRKFIKT